MSEIPFKHDLIPSNIGSLPEHREKLKEFEGRDGKIIRSVTFAELEEMVGKKFDPPAKAFEIVSESKKLFEELSETYHIPVPVDFVIGKNNKGEDCVYILTDKIEGNNLEDINFKASENKEYIEDVDELYSNLVRYFGDKFKNEETFMMDIFAPRQFVLGTRKGEDEKKIYLVDTDMKPLRGKKKVISVVSNLVDRIRLFEENQKTRFVKTREKMKEYDEIPGVNKISSA